MTITDILAELEAKAWRTTPEGWDGVGRLPKFVVCSPDRILALVAYVRKLEQWLEDRDQELDRLAGSGGYNPSPKRPLPLSELEMQALFEIGPLSSDRPIFGRLLVSLHAALERVEKVEADFRAIQEILPKLIGDAQTLANVMCDESAALHAKAAKELLAGHLDAVEEKG